VLNKLFLAFFIFLNGVGSFSAAQSFSGQINPYPVSFPLFLKSADTLKILAVMVNFKEDKDAATFGNGKFGTIYSQNYGNTILDPLPHDRQYFESHLEFVKNYFFKVSNGNLNISYKVLEDTFSVSQTMRNYSPPGKSSDFTPLANFSQEAWTIADQLNPGFNFSDYDVFLIFHAGVGRDVTLPGSIGGERDLPSVYLSLNALKSIFGQSFNGFPVSGGNFRITNSIIIPETESRELSSFGGTVLFNLTINGLLVASVASHLGLPDLFDTETGLSAIGRFGLMDGQSIFAYNGAFPPEPSPWEKIYLGWTNPSELIQPGEYDIDLYSKLATPAAGNSILKIPLNSSEYYLVENRNRDVFEDGAQVTYRIGNQTFTKTFLKDTTGFYSFDLDSVDGVVIDVDEFDWAVPGNGIVIWHIDQNVIDQKIIENKINTDKNLRGVDVEEADGIQDIGERFFTIFGDEVIGEGEPQDFWFRDNKSELYTNEFSSETRPSTLTNSGSNSLIKFSDFSQGGKLMSFKLVFGDSIVKPIFSSMNWPLSVNHLARLASGNGFILQSGNEIYMTDNSGSLKSTINDFSDFKPATNFWNNSDYVFGLNSNGKLAYYITDGISSVSGAVNSENVLTTVPVIRKTPSEVFEILAGTNNGKVILFNSGILNSELPSVKQVVDLQDTSLTINKIAANELYYCLITKPKNNSIPSILTTLFYDSEGKSFEFENEIPVDLALTKDANGKYLSVVLTSLKYVFLISEGKLVNKFQLKANGDIKSISLSDLKQDGANYILYNDGISSYAVNLSGSLSDYFPLVDPIKKGFSGLTLSADFEGTDDSEILSFTSDGRIFSFNGANGEIIRSFPISSGSELTCSPLVYERDGKLALAVIDNRGSFRSWFIGSSSGKRFWSEANADNFNSSFIPGAETTNFINQYFPADRVYNYPNPVYDGITFLRYYVSEDAEIKIQIFDLAGDYVAELNDYAIGGMDNETEWNVDNIQSGIYLARIEAKSSSGKSEFAVIKIAVVK
jgi:hypothetical protein